MPRWGAAASPYQTHVETTSPPGTKRLKLQHDEPPSNFACKLKLRRYLEAQQDAAGAAAALTAAKLGTPQLPGEDVHAATDGEPRHLSRRHWPPRHLSRPHRPPHHLSRPLISPARNSLPPPTVSPGASNRQPTDRPMVSSCEP